MQPPSGQQTISLPNIQSIIAIASGKGGVGKSTVAANLALALYQGGARVGLMDADIYGPSIPLMMGVGPINPQATPFPIERHGLKLMSMGFVLGDDQAAVLRGPMIHRYLVAFLTQIDWGQLDYLLIDMPPGTGDAQLSLAQTAPLSGALTVVTPQDLSLTVARRGLEMFRKVRVPLLGIIENMSYFVGEDGRRYEIFRHGGGRKLAAAVDVPFLGEVPIDPRVAECGDQGAPIVVKYPDSPVAKAYAALAAAVSETVRKKSGSDELPEAQL
jgi:ATP-binding protein involved in chromosome partitioning